MKKITDNEIRKAIKALNEAEVPEIIDVWIYCSNCKEVHLASESKEGCFSEILKLKD